MTPYSLLDSTTYCREPSTYYLPNYMAHTANDSILDIVFCKNLQSHNAEYADIPYVNCNMVL